MDFENLAGAFAPSVLILLLLVAAVAGAQPELVILLLLVVVQIVWAAAWFGVPWIARKAGVSLGT